MSVNIIVKITDDNIQKGDKYTEKSSVKNKSDSSKKNHIIAQRIKIRITKSNVDKIILKRAYL